MYEQLALVGCLRYRLVSMSRFGLGYVDTKEDRYVDEGVDYGVRRERGRKGRKKKEERDFPPKLPSHDYVFYVK